MKLDYLIPIFTLIAIVHCGCLVKTRVGQVSKCIVEENVVTDEFLQELCKNLTSIAELSIIAEYKNELSSYRTLESYCNLGAVGRLSWIRSKDIYEYLLNSEKVDIVRVNH